MVEGIGIANNKGKSDLAKNLTSIPKYVSARSKGYSFFIINFEDLMKDTLVLCYNM